MCPKSEKFHVLWIKHLIHIIENIEKTNMWHGNLGFNVRLCLYFNLKLNCHILVIWNNCARSSDFRKVYMYGVNIMVNGCNLPPIRTRFEKNGQILIKLRSKLRSYVYIFGVLAKTRYFSVKIRAFCHEYNHIHVYLSEIMFLRAVHGRNWT